MARKAKLRAVGVKGTRPGGAFAPNAAIRVEQALVHTVLVQRVCTYPFYCGPPGVPYY
jgi:hypothetical protein